MKAYFETDSTRYTQIYFFSSHNNSCPPHFHSQIELYIVNEGKNNVTINSQSRVLKKGEMSIALPYDIHTYQTVGDSLVTCLIIPDDMAVRFRMMVDKKQNATPFITDPETVRTVMECVNQIRKFEGQDLLIRGNCYIILGTIYDHMEFTDTKQDVDTELSSMVLFYLEDNFKENLTLDKAASDLGYSPYYLSRFFNRYFQCSFNDYINMIRLRNFLNILKENDFNITYCAYESGFTSIRTFNRAFKKEFEITPKEFIAKTYKKGR